MEGRSLYQKIFAFLAAAVACACAAELPVYRSSEYEAPIIRSDYEGSPEGNFQYAYETGNGIYGQANGIIKNYNSDEAAQEVKGGYKYTAPDGTPVEISYIANEFGYQPVGSHIPTPPPIPEAILRSLAWIEAHPAPVATEYLIKKA